MKHTAFLLFVAARTAALLQAQPLPSAESILDHFVEVTGGKAAYQKHTSEVLVGKVTFAVMGLTGELTRYSTAPNKEYSVVVLGPLGKIETGVSGEVAWEKSAILGPRIKSGDEREQAVRHARFNSPLTWRTAYAKAETTGTDNVNGEECYKVVLTPASGKPETQFYSKKTGFLLKTTATASSPMGDMAVEVEVSGYKNFGGVLYPTRSRQKGGGQAMEIAITEVRLDEAVPAELFELPADVKALAGQEARQ